MMAASSPRLDQLRRLTDPRGLIHAAILDCPDRSCGYDTIDNADALRLCAMASDTVSADVLHQLAGVYFGFLTRARREDGCVRHGCDAGGMWHENADNALVQSRLARALAAVIVSELPIRLRLSAAEWWARLLPCSDSARTPISAANWLTALSTLRCADPGRDLDRAARLARWLLEDCYYATRTSAWEWFEPSWKPGAACIPAGLWHAGVMLDEKRYTGIARITTTFVLEHLFRHEEVTPVGSRGGWHRHGAKAQFDQTPSEVADVLELCRTAERISGNPAYRDYTLEAAAWFTGANTLRLSLIDPHTGGCCDALRADGLDRNQGAPATLAYLLAQANLSDPAPVEMGEYPQMVIG